MQRTCKERKWDETEQRLRRFLLAGLAGDERSYRTFLGELSSYLRGYFAKRLSGFPFDAEDLVQETLLAVHNQRHTYDTGQPLTAWIHAIAKYKFVDFLRLRNRQDVMKEPYDDEDAVFASREDEARDAHLDIGRLLAQLPDRFRLPIEYVKLQGLSIAETARLTGMSEPAVKIGVHRGLKVLAEKVKGIL